MISFLMFTLGLIVGSCVVTIFTLARSATGTFLIDSSSAEKDIFRLDLDKLDDVYKKKVIKLKIVRDADLSQK